jgi:hypothetical protein
MILFLFSYITLPPGVKEPVPARVVHSPSLISQGRRVCQLLALSVLSILISVKTHESFH